MQTYSPERGSPTKENPLGFKIPQAERAAPKPEQTVVDIKTPLVIAIDDQMAGMSMADLGPHADSIKAYVELHKQELIKKALDLKTPDALSNVLSETIQNLKEQYEKFPPILVDSGEVAQQINANLEEGIAKGSFNLAEAKAMANMQGEMQGNREAWDSLAKEVGLDAQSLQEIGSKYDQIDPGMKDALNLPDKFITILSAKPNEAKTGFFTKFVNKLFRTNYQAQVGSGERYNLFSKAQDLVASQFPENRQWKKE